MALFPSVLTSFSTKVNGQVIDASDVNNLQTDITQIEAVIGVAGASSVVGTYEYFVKSPASDGGGHVQAVNKGGTGKTSFNKGDILVAQSSSVLTKLAVGIDGQVLQANSSVATGITWTNNSSPMLGSSASIFAISGGGDTSVMTASIMASALGTSNAVVGRTLINQSDIRSSVIVRGIYAGATVTSVLVLPPFGSGGGAGVAGEVVHTLIANNSLNSQRSYLQVNLFSSAPVGGGALGRSSVFSYQDSQYITKDAGATQSFGATAQTVASGAVQIDGFIVQKISQ